MEFIPLPRSGYRKLVHASVTTVLAFFLFSSQLFSQSVLSAKALSGTIASGGDLYVIGSTIDASGNIYLVGWFRGTADMDPGAGVSHIVSRGNEDAFIAKYTSAGALVWARAFGGTGQDNLRDVAIDPGGNVIVSGSIQATVDMDPGPGVSKYTSSGNADFFFSKFTASGDFVYAKCMGGPFNDYTASMVLDPSGNIFLSGTLTSASVDFDPGPGVSLLTKIGTVDTWIARYDNDGNHSWSYNIGAAGSTQVSVTKMIMAPGSKLFITGYFTGGGIDFNPGAGVTTHTSSGLSDIFVASYDLTGNYSFSFAIGGTGYDFAYGIGADATGAIFITGKYEGTVDFNPAAATNNMTSSGLGDIFLAKYNSTGAYQTAKSIGTSAGDETATLLYMDGNNPVIGGSFAGTVDFDPGTPVVNLTANGSSSDVFLAKYNGSLAFTWAKSFGGPTNDQAYTITKDPSGNLNIGGYFSGTADFDPSSATVNLTAPTSVSRGYNLKLSNLGTFVAVFAPECYAAAAASSSVGATWIDADNNYYVTGAFGRTVDFDPGPGVSTLTATSFNDLFIAKYNSSGELVFARSVGNTNGMQGNGIVTDAAGNIYVAGRFQGTLDIDPGPGVVNISSQGNNDIFLLKLNSSGNYLASGAIGGSGAEAVNALAIDNAGSLYITGQFATMVDFNPSPTGVNSLTSKGGSDAFVAKYNSSLNYVYAVQLGGTMADSGNDIVVDAAGNVYTIGTFGGKVDFDPGAGVVELTSAGGNDIFISKLDKNGNYANAFRLGGAGSETGSGITVDNAGNIYVAGSFVNIVDFDPGAGTRELTSAGSSDAFLASYSGAGSLIAVNSFGGILNELAQKIKLDSKGNIYVAGQYYSAQLTFDYKGTPVSFNNEGDADVFLAVFNSALQYRAGRSIGNVSTDMLGGLSLDATDKIYLGGSFANVANIDNLPNAFSTITARDIFMAKFSVPETLPVTLEKFTAVVQQSEVLTRWTVSAQINNHYFEVERSADGKQFQTVGRVMGCADCAARMDYQLTDTDPLPGISYYRLKQTDIDKNYSYSKIVRVSFYNNKGDLKLIPTATTGDFTMAYFNQTNKTQSAVVRLVNASGITVQTSRVLLKPGVNNIPMSLMNYASGLYYVNLVLSSSNTVQNAVVVKQR